MHFTSRIRRTVVLLLNALPCTVVPAADSDELITLRAQVQRLQQDLATLTRRLDQLTAPAASTPTAAKAVEPPVAPPAVSIEEKGIVLGSSETNLLRIRGLVQIDVRNFFGDGGGLVNNSVLLRRARVFTEGQFGKNFRYQLADDFGGSTVGMLDANLTLSLSKGLQVKFGKFKVPLGQELLQSESWTYFNERSLVTNLVPNRDLGVQAMGEWGEGVVSYQAGVFNGVADGGSSTNADFDNEKEGVLRVMFAPFRQSADTPLRGLSFGIAGSSGRAKTTAGRTAGYRTDAQQVFFSYNAATAADGRSWRVVPQFDYRIGPLGLTGECALSTVNVRLGAAGPKTELRNRAWRLAAGYVLTGEDSAADGIWPRNRLDLAAGTWGAIELVAGLARLDVDSAAFPVYASPASSAEDATATSIGINWYLSHAFVFKFDYFTSRFGFNSLAPAVSANSILRQREQALVTRFQVTF